MYDGARGKRSKFKHASDKEEKLLSLDAATNAIPPCAGFLDQYIWLALADNRFSMPICMKSVSRNVGPNQIFPTWSLTTYNSFCFIAQIATIHRDKKRGMNGYRLLDPYTKRK